MKRRMMGWSSCAWGCGPQGPNMEYTCNGEPEGMGYTHYRFDLLSNINLEGSIRMHRNGSLHMGPCRSFCQALGNGDPLSPYCSQGRANDTRFVGLRDMAHKAGTEVLLEVSEMFIPGGVIKGFDNASMSDFMSDEVARAEAVRGLVRLRADAQVDGFGFDFEAGYVMNKTLSVQLISFFGDVKRALVAAQPQAPSTISVAIPAMLDPPIASIWNFSALAESVDIIAMMTYDFDGGGGGVTGATSPLTGGDYIHNPKSITPDWHGNVKAQVEYVQQFGGAKAQKKVVWGVPWYGHEWPTVGSGTDRGNRTLRKPSECTLPCRCVCMYVCMYVYTVHSRLLAKHTAVSVSLWPCVVCSLGNQPRRQPQRRSGSALRSQMG